jgi:hypothetical protein
MSHSRREQTYRDLRDSDLRPFDMPTQSERDRMAAEIANEIGDDPESDGAIVQRIVDNDPTDRVEITSMPARLTELVDAHDADAPPFPEFARRRTDAPVYDLDDYREDLDVTRTDLRAMPAIAMPASEPSWPQTIRMGIADALKEVL